MAAVHVGMLHEDLKFLSSIPTVCTQMLFVVLVCNKTGTTVITTSTRYGFLTDVSLYAVRVRYLSSVPKVATAQS